MSEVLKRRMRCAVHTRKSTAAGPDQDYNSIDAERDAGHACIASQRAEGWIPVADDYDDPAFSGGNVERPALRRLMADIEAGKIDIVVVYKIDRLKRSLADFTGTVDVFERCSLSFVSVTQQFNTTTSMGRVMLNIRLSFAQFEREVTADMVEASDGRVTLSVPIQIKRRSRRKLVTLPSGETANARPWDTAPTPLQMVLARGHRWLAMLESGAAKSLEEIAATEGIDSSYVSRMVNLTTLAPDIVAAILDDAIPNHVTRFDLAVDPLALWEEQRVRLAPRD